jgi:SAM-dependent methyltransferase
MHAAENEHDNTIAGFGDEWSRFDQSGANSHELEQTFDQYFAIFPWAVLPAGARGVDVGCGSGRWARLVAPRVAHLDCVDASPDALEVARRNLAQQPNITLTVASVGALPFSDATFDLGYSLGVLHHVPDTLAGMKECVRVLKPGAPFLVYLYYALDNRPAWYRGIWKASDAVRRLVSALPAGPRHVVADAIAAGVYWPLARAALLSEHLGLDVSLVPLASYRRHSFYIMRNDALDRMGTQLEQRFSRTQIEEMMLLSGLTGIRFHEGVPFWCAVGFKAT